MAETNVNDILAANLARLMAEREKTQLKLSKNSGVGQTTISLYLNPDRRQPSKSGKIPSAKLSEVEALARALDVPVWDLLKPMATAQSSISAKSKLTDLQKIVAEAKEAANEDELVPIRRAAVKIVGGDPVIAIDAGDNEFDGVIYLARSWLLSRGLSRDRVFAATVTGDSMAPRIQEGDLLLINQADTDRREGHVYGVSHEGRFMAKRLKRELGRWWLTSDNPEHAPILAEGDTKIIGRVVLMQTEKI